MPAKTKSIGPVLQYHSLAAMLKNDIPTMVSILLGVCCPNHVPWFISAAVVYPLNGVGTGGRIADMIVERLEGVCPLRKHAYPPLSVVFVRITLWLKTSLLYVCPRFVRLASRTSLGVPVRRMHPHGVTSATDHRPRAQMILANPFNRSAVALAIPDMPVPLPSGIGQN